MNDNLPPGVTGREDVFGPQFVREETRECQGMADFRVYPPEVEKALEAADMQALAKVLRTATDSVVIKELDCPFEGSVEVEYWNTSYTWQCPLCGWENEDTLEMNY